MIVGPGGGVPAEPAQPVFPLALLAQPALPEGTRDALWRAGVAQGWKAEFPAPQPPSADLLAELAPRVRASEVAALAARVP
jgi:hypothetical protein